MADISFRRLTTGDLPLIHRWLHTPHVARWWYEDLGTPEEVSRRYTAYIEDGAEPVEPYLILCGDRPVGYIQSYRVADDEEYERLVDIPDSVGIDVFIGEEELLYRGFGPFLIRRFLRDFVFADETVEVCIIDPEPGNGAAIRAYEKVGFRHFASADTSEGPAYLMRLGRKDFYDSVGSRPAFEA